MRLSANRIRLINRSISQANRIIRDASDGPRRVSVERAKLPTSAIPALTLRIVAVRKALSA